MNLLADTEQVEVTAAEFQALLERCYEALQAQAITNRLRSYREQP